MGSRGAFIDADAGNFEFKENGQKYMVIGTLNDDSNVEMIMRTDSKSVAAPRYSHTKGRVYGVIQGNKLKYLAFYDANNLQARSVDFGHYHDHMAPHVHIYMNHDPNLPGIPPTSEELALAEKINKQFKLERYHL